MVTEELPRRERLLVEKGKEAGKRKRVDSGEIVKEGPGPRLKTRNPHSFLPRWKLGVKKTRGFRSRRI